MCGGDHNECEDGSGWHARQHVMETRDKQSNTTKTKGMTNKRTYYCLLSQLLSTTIASRKLLLIRCVTLSTEESLVTKVSGMEFPKQVWQEEGEGHRKQTSREVKGERSGGASLCLSHGVREWAPNTTVLAKQFTPKTGPVPL
ncbi:hypothetical protein Pmani_024301 [Petrolisthes manimaculis]|uniref:Uncharacterized protein n=1 Tax=Petrolisthes manimaculis TaxID=1843537 RepID=A0AAE1U2E1_9EUCA|nr:hypothetical protein Pmani_024301 [Petrolisthes manimaculis]